MTIYNKPFFFAGIILFNICLFLDYFEGTQASYLLIPMFLGVVLILLGFKRKGVKE